MFRRRSRARALATSPVALPLGPTLFALAIAALGLAAGQNAFSAERMKLKVRSSVDGTDQLAYAILPGNYKDDSQLRPLVVSLHTWSGNVEQRNKPLEEAAEKRGWIYLFPNFRGANNHPDACGSKIAQQDILDALQYAKEKFRVDHARIYLTGVSGGGHMTMLMVGRHPEPWAAASAWVGISDLAAWHTKHSSGKYGQMMRRCCGGSPEDSAVVAKQYTLRSPLTFLQRAKAVPVDIAAGIHDGHKGSVPIRHSLEAFNVLAKAAASPLISDREIEELSRVGGKLSHPKPSDQVTDKHFGRAIYLRRMAGPSRVSIFEGGHEGIAAAAIEWLARHKKKRSN